MHGLLRKDLYVADRSSRLLLLLALLFNMFPAGAVLGNTYTFLLAFFTPVTAVSSDERCQWDRLAAMLPYTMEELVGGKYLLSGIYILLAAAVNLLGAAVRNVLDPGSAQWPDSLAAVAVMVLAMASATAVTLPLLYRFNSERARLLLMAPLAGGFGMAAAAFNLSVVYGGMRVPFLLVLVCAILFAVVLYGSFRLSVYFYRNRRHGKYN